MPITRRKKCPRPPNTRTHGVVGHALGDDGRTGRERAGLGELHGGGGQKYISDVGLATSSAQHRIPRMLACLPHRPSQSQEGSGVLI